MTTVVTAPRTTVTLTPPFDRRTSPLQYATIAPSIALSSAMSSASRPPRSSPRSNASPESAARSPPSRTASDGNPSPGSLRAPMIKVKKEPGSPSLSTSSRPRPRRLDLSSSMSAGRGPQTAGPSAPLTSKESAGLAIKDLGVACLSPGFQTHDPTMREQLQRSLSVRDQQRQLIEARQKGGSKPMPSHDGSDQGQRTSDNAVFGASAKEPRRKGPPPGLSINAPSASSFANERVVQSAPLHQSFTGLRPHHTYPHQPSNLSQTSHIHHVPATQTANRLPPIADVFAGDRFEAPPSASLRSGFHHPQPSPSHPPQLQSPGYPPQHHQQHPQPPPTARSREFRSAEEAVQNMSGGREELLPKIVHYGGVQPPTPPSPMPPHHQHSHHPHHTASHPPHAALGHNNSRPELGRTSSLAGRRRTHEEYEHSNGSPSAQQGEHKRYAREEEDWRAGMSGREKRERFIRLCEEAWDLFHS